MITAFLLRKKSNEPAYTYGGPQRWSLPRTIEHFLTSISVGGEITVMNWSQIAIVTPLPLGNGSDEDRFEGEREDLIAIACAGAYWHTFQPSLSGRVANITKCAIMAQLPHLQTWRPAIANWLGERPRFSAEHFRIALMLACDITDVVDLEMGLATPTDPTGPHSALVAALELHDEERRYGRFPTLRDILVATAA